ncbi:F-box protein [Camellia lanceoleosa]|uniref:F-box protein n=1 Tax=Camellia lanceoleosa TaxID=1840588 RepID=A0ACC0HJ95_9ERIC|nr:F-box protein [Camellia lanceoleosa]
MRVGVLRGCLTICDFATVKYQGSIWVMKDYGVKESWSKDIVIKGVIYDWDYSNCYEPIMILRSGQLLILVNGEALVLYDPKTRYHKNVKISGIRKRSDFHGIAHVPSLVSLRDVAKGENLKFFAVFAQARTIEILINFLGCGDCLQKFCELKVFLLP